jgi:hypothetical protein
MLKHHLRDRLGYSRSACPNRRRGAATLWMLIWAPCLLVLFSVLVGVANLWLARVELERQEYVLITTNYDVGAPNENAQCNVLQSPPAGNLIFGSIDDVTDPGDVTFRADIEPTGAPTQKFGVRAQAIVPVQSFLGSSFLGAIGSYRVQTKATAVYDSSAPTNKARLIRIDTYFCP